MNQTRLNWCMVLHIHNDDTDKLNIPDVANEFVMEDLCKIFFIVFYCFNFPQMQPN